MDQNKQIYYFKVFLVGGIALGSGSLDFNNKLWMNSARYVLYILTVRTMYGACAVAYDVAHKKRAIDANLIKQVNGQHVMIFLTALGVLLYNKQTLVDNSFFFILIATVVAMYPEVVREKKRKVSVNYAVGMACSYFEGYLMHILPSDGAKFFGFANNMRVYEDREGVLFPVRKLFIVATKSLYSPPALEDLNPPDRDDVSKLEACSPLSEVEKDVAGVKNRIYKNFAYKIYRPNRLPVCVSAVGGTPMHTLFRVLKNRDLSEVLTGINREEIVADFFKALQKIIDKSPECRNKCELIYFDDRDLNLADVLLDRIRELEPNFEEIIAQRR